MAGERPGDQLIGIKLAGSYLPGIPDDLGARLKAFETSRRHRFLDRFVGAHSRRSRGRGASGHADDATCSTRWGRLR